MITYKRQINSDLWKDSYFIPPTPMEKSRFVFINLAQHSWWIYTWVGFWTDCNFLLVLSLIGFSKIFDTCSLFKSQLEDYLGKVTTWGEK